MKKTYKIMLGALAGVMFAATAYAVPFTPSGPLFIKFTGVEQVSTIGGILLPRTATGESNWGVAVILQYCCRICSRTKCHNLDITSNQYFR